MEYKITMPLLSDTMEKGKLIKWHVKEGDFVKKSDVIAEVESDKAVMEIQTFKSGVVKKLLVKEGEEVPVKTPIAIIDTNKSEKLKVENEKTDASEKLKVESEKKEEKQSKDIKPTNEPSTTPLTTNQYTNTPLTNIHIQGTASPAAKKEASKYNIDIEKLQNEGILPKPAHLEDIKNYLLSKYFTPKALKLLKEYKIDANNFKLDHKIDFNEVIKYIKQNNIPKITPISLNQKAVILNVENAKNKPTYFVFDEFEINVNKKYKLTSIILKTIGDVMQNHPKIRSILKEDTLLTYPASNISVALQREDGLYMVVCKRIEEKSIEEVDEWVRSIKTKKFNADDFEGSTFGLSNLGMTGIDRFSAMINKNDSGIVAVGSLIENKIKVTFTFDHRIVNGYEAALFVKELKEVFKEKKYV